MVYFDILACICVKLKALFIFEQFKIQTIVKLLRAAKVIFLLKTKTKTKPNLFSLYLRPAQVSCM